MKKAAAVLLTALLVLFVFVSCGEDPFFYKVTFDSTGGSEVKSQAVYSGNTVSKPDSPTREGYVFVRWSTEKDGETEFDFTTVITADITLYAVWKAEDGSGSETPTPTPTPTPVAKTISITYDLNGGTLADGVTNPATATEGETVTPTGPARGESKETGVSYSIDDYLYCDTADVTTTYTFKGWKVDGADDSTAAATYTAGTENVKLVAVWNTTSTATNCSATKLKDTVSVGTTVTLGYYTSALEWKVLAVDTANKKALLFATNVVSTSMENGSGSTSDPYSWGTGSPIYKWFNNTTSTGFLSQCRLTNVSMVDNGNVGKVFLLSEGELTTYLPNAPDRVCGYHWWLRTNGSQVGTCKYVLDSGSVGDNKQAVTTCAVRPAFWISL